MWREVAAGDGLDQAEPSIRSLLDLVSSAAEPLTLRSTSGGVAIVTPWEDLAASSQIEASVESDARFHRVALMLTAPTDEAGGLLRYADVVALPGAGGGAPPTGLAACGRLTVLDPTAPVAGLELYRAASVDRGAMLRGAPVDLRAEEDLDAREDWFKKRHGDGE